MILQQYIFADVMVSQNRVGHWLSMASLLHLTPRLFMNKKRRFVWKSSNVTWCNQTISESFGEPELVLALGRLMYSDSLISELVYLECGEVTNGAKNIIISEPAALRALIW